MPGFSLACTTHGYHVDRLKSHNGRPILEKVRFPFPAAMPPSHTTGLMRRLTPGHLWIDALLAGILLIAGGPAAAQPTINEIRISQPAPLQDFFFELQGIPGTSLNGHTYVVLGSNGVASHNGVVENAVSLEGLSIPTDGHFLAAHSEYALGGSIDLQTALSFLSDGNKTHLLVMGFGGSVGDDLDSDDDGVVDGSPWTSVISCVSLLDTSGSGDEIYCGGTTVGPETESSSEFLPGHVYVDGGWQIGLFSGGDETPGFANSALPVELASFSAQVHGSDVVLSWTTLSESGVAGFAVERQQESGFQEIGFVEARGRLTGETDYAHSVSGLVPGTHVFRLRIDDLDGSQDVSSAVEVFLEIAGDYVISNPYPNPFNPSVSIDVSVQRDQDVSVTVYDMLGQYVSTLHSGRLTVDEARTFRFDAVGASSGLYVVRIVGEHFSATRQAVLLK
jgi:hypothetical protein